MEVKEYGVSHSETPSGGLSPYVNINAAVVDAFPRDNNHYDLVRQEYDDTHPVTAAQVVEIITKLLSGLRVNVLESDITKAQKNVKRVADESYF